jgi:hypothetical protein
VSRRRFEGTIPTESIATPAVASVDGSISARADLPMPDRTAAIGITSLGRPQAARKRANGEDGPAKPVTGHAGGGEQPKPRGRHAEGAPGRTERAADKPAKPDKPRKANKGANTVKAHQSISGL